MGRDYTSEPTRKRLPSQPILCSKCGLSGGTLVKAGDYYECQDKTTCSLMKLRIGQKSGLER